MEVFVKVNVNVKGGLVEGSEWRGIRYAEPADGAGPYRSVWVR